MKTIHTIVITALLATASLAHAITTINWERDDDTGVSIRFRGVGDLHPTFEEKKNFSLLSPSGLWRFHTVAHAAFIDKFQDDTEYLVMGIDASLDYLPRRQQLPSFLTIPNYEDYFDWRHQVSTTMSLWSDEIQLGWYGFSALMVWNKPDLRDNSTWEWEAVHHLRGPSLAKRIPDAGSTAVLLTMALGILSAQARFVTRATQPKF